MYIYRSLLHFSLVGKGRKKEENDFENLSIKHERLDYQSKKVIQGSGTPIYLLSKTLFEAQFSRFGYAPLSIMLEPFWCQVSLSLKTTNVIIRPRLEKHFPCFHTCGFHILQLRLLKTHAHTCINTLRHTNLCHQEKY